MALTGHRKFWMGIIGISILFTMNVTVLMLFLYSLLSSDHFTSIFIETGKVVGIIVASFMACNTGEHIINTIKEGIKQRRKK
jgi:hypothetical protein